MKTKAFFWPEGKVVQGKVGGNVKKQNQYLDRMQLRPLLVTTVTRRIGPSAKLFRMDP